MSHVPSRDLDRATPRDPTPEPEPAADPVSGPAAGAAPGPGPGAPPGAARPAARLVVRLSRDDVGARVTVRHRLPAGASASLSDVVGVLTAWGDDDVLHVERRDGSTVALSRSDVVAAKVVPAAEPRPAP